MMNLVQKSDRPNVGPMNKLSDMVSNFGGEILFLLLTIWGGNTGSILIVCVIALLIRLPIMLLGKFQPEYGFESSGYFEKFE
ncbi:hypothetical protein [Eisenbergiella sp.]